MKLVRKPTFDKLAFSIEKAHQHFAMQASKAVNVGLTQRNWVIGYYIAEYELRGQNRALYGEKLLSELSKKLSTLNASNCNKRQLYIYLRFSKIYPQIVRTLSAQFRPLLPIGETLSPQLGNPPLKLITNLSFSHFVELIGLDDPLKRSFYETECIRGHWSVRELKRQIASLLFERTALSKDKKKLLKLTHEKNDSDLAPFPIRDPYIFEFLGLKSKEVMGESDLEDALLDKLQDFILELGHGFCFEARQKRIIIGGEYFFVDLVFYHRILKCHVLIELKVDDFKHDYLGQLNTYVGYYAKHEHTPGDNPPIGILLCTKKNHALVEYALAGISNTLFVSKYQVELPKKEEIENFLNATLKEIK